LRTHDARQHVHAPRAPSASLAHRRAGERDELGMQLRAEIFDQRLVGLFRRQQPDQRGLVEREPVIGCYVVGGARRLGHAAAVVPSIQSSTGRHKVSRCRDAKKPSWPMRLEPASAGEYQRVSRAAFGKNF
jgi:hypothetical protein